jgi:chemotaxis protein MotB
VTASTGSRTSARRRRGGEPASNHERWLVSYADFITLLFAFFVVMFANSQVDRERVSRVSESVKGALEGGVLPVYLEGYLGRARDVNAKGLGNQKVKGNGAADGLSELLPSLQSLTRQMDDEIRDGKLQVQLTPRGLMVSMREAALFGTGDDAISPGAHQMVEKLAATINALPNPVRLEGHTDSTPIRTPRFRSNWELSAARAIAMMELLTTKFNVPKQKVAIAGYADTIALVPNTTPEGRARNRRVDIIILNRNGLGAEPQATAGEGPKPGTEAAPIINGEPPAGAPKGPVAAPSKAGAAPEASGKSAPPDKPAATPQPAPSRTAAPARSRAEKKAGASPGAKKANPLATTPVSRSTAASDIARKEKPSPAQ